LLQETIMLAICWDYRVKWGKPLQKKFRTKFFARFDHGSII
jgi:hypothetical protein